MTIKRQKRIEDLCGPKMSRIKVIRLASLEDQINDIYYLLESKCSEKEQLLKNEIDGLNSKINDLRFKLDVAESRIPDISTIDRHLNIRLAQLGLYNPPSGRIS